MKFSTKVKLVVAIVLIVLISSKIMSLAKTAEQGLEDMEKIYDFEEVVIMEGDSAWQTQRELTPNADIRELLYYLEIVNDKDSMGNLSVGEKLFFFVEKAIN